ncbi:NUDIX domain-containing protein [Roseomonas sp. SG15]|uniref:NUDIX domain-containing protein n=2 Tax=Roseomonas indoligenes TaxID=2820811 RepID=A0A940MWC0_9PROT|nr:NUDIX domain-containing protein [Pararoseomonas indoligenes]MBP0492407.1 NUDIX domain-containing protein [Pararoseomonas indoligenes]
MRPTDFTAAGEAPPTKPVHPRDAATLLLWRESGGHLEVLMGVRSVKHRFMPSRLVFPGGRVDLEDRTTPVLSDLHPPTRRALEHRAPSRLARAIAVAAARELMEETGLLLGRMENGRLHADLAPMRYLCRAVTPAMSPVRFNARFLMAPAETVSGELAGSGELEHLEYHRVDSTPAHDMAPITAKVLGEFRDLMALPEAERETRPLVWYQGRDTRRLERAQAGG